MAASQAEGTVVFVQHCALELSRKPWDFASDNATAIDDHWNRRRRSNPAFFNGVVHVLEAGTIVNGTFHATFKRTDFKSFLYWRETGYPDAAAHDAFGSALVVSREGHVVLGRQRAGNINAGIAYLPGGFIDQRDVANDGTIDIAASIRRELTEETGLTEPDVVEQSGFLAKGRDRGHGEPRRRGEGPWLCQACSVCRR